ncbi:MAG: heme-binding protein [Actinobacteria bacterium]|nr:heme-binding protein [Actinomycetota bacterium]
MSHEPIAPVHRAPQVSYHAARAAIAAGLAECTRIGMNCAIVVTDPAGEMVAVARTDGASGNTYSGALGKARTAAVLGASTEDYLEQRLLHDEVLYRALTADQQTFLVPGGFPLLVDGVVVGGVGVSGGLHEDDAKVARAAMERFAELVATSASGPTAT